MHHLKPIGTIHTPYLPGLPIPEQPNTNASGEFWINLDPELVDGLERLSSYRYIYVIYYLDQTNSGEVELKVNPPWAPNQEVGLFASRSPNRPNPIGLSIVELKGIEGNEIIISGIDAYNGTPLLDIKPYLKSLDIKTDANDGWCDELPDKDHLFAHLLGIDHEHDHNHNHHHHAHSHPHTHSSDHSHSHTHTHHHEHTHSHSHEHSHGHELHTHEHTHNHDHSHSHDHIHEHSHKHSNDHKHEHNHLHNHDYEHDHTHEKLHEENEQHNHTHSHKGLNSNPTD